MDREHIDGQQQYTSDADDRKQALRDNILFKCKLAEQSDRYNDMLDYAIELLKVVDVLDEDERSMVSVAFKNYVGVRRASWRALSEIEVSFPPENDKLHILSEYKRSIEEELDRSCFHVLELIDKYILKSLVDVESRVFILKMKADYHRYTAETKSGDELAKYAKITFDIYDEAYTLAQSLPTTNIVRLGLALNFSVFYFEIQRDLDKARELAKKAFEEALPLLDNMPDSQSKDASIILQLLRDNLSLWNASPQREEDGNE